jgi:GMP synthase-like glutamine amidotransferase
MHAPSTMNGTSAVLTRDDTAPFRRPALVVSPRPTPVAAPLVDALIDHALVPVAVAGGEDDPLPDPGSAPLVILVSEERLSDARAAGRVAREVEWVRRADAAGTPVLGIGHGARVLALALGGAVQPAPRPLRGWTIVDTAVPHQIAGGPWLAWQHDVITLPRGAQQLAHNRLGPQAFRFGRHLGVQFHPEATPEVVAGWAGGHDASAEAQAHLNVIRRDPTASAVCTRRLLSSFIGGI